MKSKQLTALLLAVILLFALSACGDGNVPSQQTPDSDNPANLLLGEWIYETGGYTYEFKADGSGTYNVGDTVMKFTYEVDGSTLSLTYEGVTTPTDLEYSVEGKTLNIKDSFGSDTIYKKK